MKYNGKDIRDINIWKTPGSGIQEPLRRAPLPSHADPTANTAIANVMREQNEKRRRKLIGMINEDKARRQAVKEKLREEKRQREEKLLNGSLEQIIMEEQNA